MTTTFTGKVVDCKKKMPYRKYIQLSLFLKQWSRNLSRVAGAISVGSGCGFDDNWIMCPHVCKLSQGVGKMTHCHGSSLFRLYVFSTDMMYIYCVLIVGGGDQAPLLTYWGGGGNGPPGSYVHHCKDLCACIIYPHNIICACLTIHK